MRLSGLVLTVFCMSLGVPPEVRGFSFDDLVAKAQKLSLTPYQAPQPVPEFLRNLDYSTYQGIRFKPEKNLWRDGRSQFQVILVSPGLYYTHSVRIHAIDGSKVETVPYRRDDFTFPSPDIEARIPTDLGFAGFKLTYPLTGDEVRHQFASFAGASYFRAVGKENVFGLSARGIAVDTGLASGEQFPSFVEFWLVRPDPAATAMTVYALLDGESVTGAYQFKITPGDATKLAVKTTLFPRKQIRLLGVAPLTSMFFYGENTPRPAGEWRPQVHDSDTLLIQDGTTGEWLSRPLLNPKQLREEYLQTDNVRGFGLLQTQSRFGDYQDIGARYDKRPSAWIVPEGDWGKGSVVLVQIPAGKETEDNIVAFWSPKTPAVAGTKLTYAYVLTFGNSDLPGEPMGRVSSTFVGDGGVIGGGQVQGAYRIIVDFEGGELDHLPADAPLKAVVTGEEGAQVIQQNVEYIAPSRRWRLSVLAKPAQGKPLGLRAFLEQGSRTLTATWTYRLPWDNKIRGR